MKITRKEEWRKRTRNNPKTKRKKVHKKKKDERGMEEGR